MNKVLAFLFIMDKVRNGQFLLLRNFFSLNGVAKNIFLN